jgi:hypothetical protein
VSSRDQNQFLLYTAPDGTVKVEVFFKNETVWLTQKALAEWFGVKVPAINKRLKNMIKASVVSILEHTAMKQAGIPGRTFFRTFCPGSVGVMKRFPEEASACASHAERLATIRPYRIVRMLSGRGITS